MVYNEEINGPDNILTKHINKLVLLNFAHPKDDKMKLPKKGANSGDHSREVETFLLKGQLRRPGVLPKCYFNIAYCSPGGWSGTSEKKKTAKKKTKEAFFVE